MEGGTTPGSAAVLRTHLRGSNGIALVDVRYKSRAVARGDEAEISRMCR